MRRTYDCFLLICQTNVKGNSLAQGCIVIFSSGVDLVWIPLNLWTDG